MASGFQGIQMFPSSWREGAAAAEDSAAVPDFKPRLDRAAHRAALAEIKARIAAGDTYQVNFTFPLDAQGPAAHAALPRLLRAQPTRQAAAVITDEWAVASASPELFYRLDGRNITMRPMKGTRPRGRHRRGASPRCSSGSCRGRGQATARAAARGRRGPARRC